jgi:hypothetical protein
MAMGPVFLASMFKMPIVPVGVGYCRPWRANTWDRFAIGRPFSRARIVTGPKIYLPNKLSRLEMEDYRRLIERLINQLTDFSEDWATRGFHVQSSEPLPKSPRKPRPGDAGELAPDPTSPLSRIAA